MFDRFGYKVNTINKMEFFTILSPFVYLHVAGQVLHEYSKRSDSYGRRMEVVNRNIGILGNVMMDTAIRNTTKSMFIIGGAFCLVVVGLGGVYLCFEIVPLIYREVRKINVYSFIAKFKRRIL